MVHYDIHKTHVDGEEMFEFGKQRFSSLSELIEFYRRHYLGTTPLRWPVPRESEVRMGLKSKLTDSTVINHCFVETIRDVCTSNTCLDTKSV